jgi:hypothetical protein
LAAASALLAPPAAAQETIATYFAALGPQDFFNSRGEPLRDFGAVLQQDRANYHRFGRADPQDQGDAYFADRANRAMIPALFAAGNNAWWASRVTPPRSAPLDADILVFLCGSGGMITHLIVNHANGDGYITCEGPEFAGQ